MAAMCDNKSRELSGFNYVVRLFAPIIWSGIICWLSLTSSPLQIPGILGWDKLLHAAAYALLTVLVAQYLHVYSGNWIASVYAGLLATVYGGLMEVLQLMVQTGRTAEWSDMAADIVGALAGYVIFRRAVVLLSQYHARS